MKRGETVHLRIVIQESDFGKRLDSFITEHLNENPAEMSRSRIARWIEQGNVSIGDQVVLRPGLKLKKTDEVAICLPPPAEYRIRPDPNIVISPLYEDDELLVINKPAGLVVHPGAGAVDGTLVHGLLAHLGESLRGIGDVLRPGIVHRLDKNTSGVLVVAKTQAAHISLGNQFKQRKVKKLYIALVLRLPRNTKKTDFGVISLPIGRSAQRRTLMSTVSSKVRMAETHWRLTEKLGTGFLLELKLITGRTHQIRVHLHATGAAIVGDPDYSVAISDYPKALRGIVSEFGRQALHATRLDLTHPTTGKEMSFEAPIPGDMLGLLAAFRKVSSR